MVHDHRLLKGLAMDAYTIHDSLLLQLILKYSIVLFEGVDAAEWCRFGSAFISNNRSLRSSYRDISFVSDTCEEQDHLSDKSLGTGFNDSSWL